MVNFGHVLTKHRVSGWPYVEYESLKQLIAEAMSSSEAWTSSEWFKTCDEKFMALLEKDMTRVSDFFVMERLALKKAMRQSDEKKIEKMAARAKALQTYSVVNYLAVLKITKKFDKNSSSDKPLSPVVIKQLLKQPFYTCLADSEIFMTTHEWLAKVSSRGNSKLGSDMRMRCVGHGIPADAAATTTDTATMCTVCFESPSAHSRGVLECGHAFCWTCLARCSSHKVVTCPLCRKPQEMDPASMVIASILAEAEAPNKLKQKPEQQQQQQQKKKKKPTSSGAKKYFPRRVAQKRATASDDDSKSEEESNKAEAESVKIDEIVGGNTPPRLEGRARRGRPAAAAAEAAATASGAREKRGERSPKRRMSRTKQEEERDWKEKEGHAAKDARPRRWRARDTATKSATKATTAVRRTGGSDNKAASSGKAQAAKTLAVKVGGHSICSPHHENEDRAVILQDLNRMCALDSLGPAAGPAQTRLFAIFDGHGGRGCAEYCQANLYKSVVRQKEYVSAAPSQLAVAMTRAVLDVEHEFCRRAAQSGNRSGTCLCMAVLREDKLLVANTGDCRAVLRQGDGRIEAMSTDHKATSPSERSRIERAGGFVIRGRALGVLQPSRTIGDIAFKKWETQGVVIADPDIVQTAIKLDSHRPANECKNRGHACPPFLIIASDGVWDVIGSALAVDVVAKHLAAGNSAGRAAQRLVEEAHALGSEDDITAVVVCFGAAEADE